MMQPVPGIPLVEQADKLEKWRLDFEGVPSTINEKNTVLISVLRLYFRRSLDSGLLARALFLNSSW